MNITVKFTTAMIVPELSLRGHAVVVIDALRATSTIVTALMAGAREVVPAATAEDAVGIANRLGSGRTLLCGERGGLKVNGFHLGNSPLEYTPEAVAGKTLVMTTTNGTQALITSRYASYILCGALLNASAVAQRLLALDTPDVTLICAGTEGQFSFEDCLTAGAVVSALQSLDFRSMNLRDSARAAAILFESERHDLLGALRCSDHGTRLIDLGFDDDLSFCARLDIPGAPVPELIDSTIRIPESSPDHLVSINYDSNH
jgi:2-phosphosulfolactate phosphatase